MIEGGKKADGVIIQVTEADNICDARYLIRLNNGQEYWYRREEFNVIFNKIEELTK